MMEDEKIIKWLNGIQDRLTEIHAGIKDLSPENAEILIDERETAKSAAERMKRNIPQEMEIEGGGTTWWHVCPECHGAIDSQDHFCRHCGQAVK